MITMRARPARRSLPPANQFQPLITTASVLLLMLSLLAVVNCSVISTQASLDSAAAALRSGNLGLALPHALDAWGSGHSCPGLRIALWITYGEQPSGGLLSFVSQCSGAADSGGCDVWRAMLNIQSSSQCLSIQAYGAAFTTACPSPPATPSSALRAWS